VPSNMTTVNNELDELFLQRHKMINKDNTSELK
jgi:hypothetical protein